MTRRLRRRPAQRGWTNGHANQLRHGHDFLGDGWGDQSDLPLDEREGWPPQEIENSMREAWENFRDELMDEFQDKLERPWGWWQFDCDFDLESLPFCGDDEDFHHAEAAVLDYFGLLTPAALAAAAKDVHVTRGVLNAVYEAPFRRRWGWWRFTSPERRDYSKPQGVQLAEIERRVGDVLTNRERHILKNKIDDPFYKSGSKVWLTSDECEALGLDKTVFVLDHQ
jgi:hypothetical protein